MGTFSWLKGLWGHPTDSCTGASFDERLARNVAKTVEFAIAQTNPRLKLVEACRDRLDAPVRQAVDYLDAQMRFLPACIDVAAADWAETPLLRAFFATAEDMPRTLGASGSLRTLFDKHPDLDTACFALGVTYRERSAEGMSPHGMETQTDLSRRIACFDSPWVMSCGADEHEVRQQVYDEWLNYLIAQSVTGINELRKTRQILEDQHALLREHLRRRHSQQTDDTDSAAENVSDTALTAQFQESERQLADLGDTQAQLKAELTCLCEVFSSVQSYLDFEHKRLRLSHLNEILAEDSLTVGHEVAFTQVTFNGVPNASRAFFIGRVARSELPTTRINFSGAERLL